MLGSRSQWFMEAEAPHLLCVLPTSTLRTAYSDQASCLSAGTWPTQTRQGRRGLALWPAEWDRPPLCVSVVREDTKVGQ